MKRRHFIKTVSTSAAALSALSVTSKVIGSNDRINIALMGCGGRGELLARGFISDGAEISYVCDVNTDNMDRRAELITQLQGRAPRKLKDIRKALDDKNVDAIIVATPNHWHALPTIWSLQAGKDVYLEKPPSLTIQEGRLMIEAAKKYNRIVQVGAQNRSAPYVQTAKEYIQSGKLGDIHRIKVYSMLPRLPFNQNSQPFKLGKPQPVPDYLDWDHWLGGAPKRPFYPTIINHYGWIAFYDFSAGNLDDGIHQLDIALNLMGEPVPLSVFTTGDKFYYQGDDAQTPDTQVSMFEFDDFVLTHDMSSYMPYMRKSTSTIRRNDEFPYWTQNSTRIELYGSKELMIVGRMGGGWLTMTSGGKVVEKVYGRVPDDAHRQNFLDCLRSRKRPTGDIEIVNNSMNVGHMSNISYRVGNRKLYWDSSNECFSHDSEANALLAFDYRKKYQVPDTI